MTIEKKENALSGGGVLFFSVCKFIKIKEPSK